MKNTSSMSGGSLLSNSTGALVKYLVSFLKAYESEGIPIWALTPQVRSQQFP